MWAVVPLKSPEDAKSRLRVVLEDEVRRRLFFAMGQHVVRTLGAAPEIDGIVVVTSADEVARCAAAAGARVLRRPADAGPSEACTAALRDLDGTACSALIIFGDLPLLSQAALAPLLALDTGQAAVGLVPDRHGRGTNALLCRPPGAIPLCFGRDSFRAHVEQTRQRKLALHVIESEGLGFDIDTPEDLDALARHPAAASMNAELRGLLASAAELQP